MLNFQNTNIIKIKISVGKRVSLCCRIKQTYCTTTKTVVTKGVRVLVVVVADGCEIGICLLLLNKRSLKYLSSFIFY